MSPAIFKTTKPLFDKFSKGGFLSVASGLMDPRNGSAQDKKRAPSRQPSS